MSALNKMQCQLWMGSLEPNMTESFIMAAFNRLGQRPLTVKVMRNKFTGEPAGYAFVHFGTDDEAVDAMHKLNGKPIPGTFPIVRFRLNTASREARANMQHEREYSVWVGDLSVEVDDYTLYRVFAAKYSSIKTAKVILDTTGYSKGYGFVRFGSEEEQRNALFTMNGYIGLGTKPLKICSAVPKPKASSPNLLGSSDLSSSQEYSQYYDPTQYWQNYSAWSGYYNQDGSSQSGDQIVVATNTTVQNDALALIDHEKTVDVDGMNALYLDMKTGLWDSIEASHWFPHEIVEVN